MNDAEPSIGLPPGHADDEPRTDSAAAIGAPAGPVPFRAAASGPARQHFAAQHGDETARRLADLAARRGVPIDACVRTYLDEYWSGIDADAWLDAYDRADGVAE